MNTIPYEYAEQLLRHYEHHLQWVEKMQIQGDLALIAGDFSAYAQNAKRLVGSPLSETGQLKENEVLSINPSSVKLPPVTSVSCYTNTTADLLQAAYHHGCTNALPLVMLHGKHAKLPYGDEIEKKATRLKGMSDIDYMLEKGGADCWKAAKEKNDQPDYVALEGICYMKGLGVKTNYEQALKCFLSVAKQSALAQFCIGICYEQGYEVPKDESQAGKWYYLAARNGCWQAADVIFFKNHKKFGKEGKPLRKTLAYTKQWLPIVQAHAGKLNPSAQKALGNDWPTNVSS